MKKAFAVIALLGIAAGISYTYRAGKAQQTETLRFCYPEVSSIQDTVLLQGSVVAADKQQLYPRGTSRILECYVTEGQKVLAGQCLMKLETVGASEREAAATATVIMDLQDAITAGDFAGATELAQTIDLNYTGQTNECKEYYLYSKRDAFVMKLPAQAGETVSSFLPCITLYSPENLQIEAAAGEDVIGMLAPDMDCYISVPAFSITDLQGRVTAIAPYATEKTTITGQSACETAVRMAIDDASALRPGYRAAAKVVVAARDNALLLPYDAIRQDENGQEYVLKLQGLRVVKQIIQTGSELEDRVEVCEGIAVQDVVLLHPELRWEGALVNLANH